MAKEVQEVLSELAEANYLGDIRGLAAIFINKEGEVEIKMGFSSQDAYNINAGLDILKFTLMGDIVENASKKPKDRM